MTSKPSTTNCPNLSSGSEDGYTFSSDERFLCIFAFASDMSPYTPFFDVLPIQGERRGGLNSGGYSGGVPPLPIPNREVKPARADGTAHPWESR